MAAIVARPEMARRKRRRSEPVRALGEKEKLKVRIAELEAQIRYAADLPFSDDWREACTERAIVSQIEEELREKLQLLAKFFPEKEEDPVYWDKLTGKLY